MKVDVYFDTICPWCWVGKHNLHNAIKQFNEPVDINYKAFFLYNGIPEEGMAAKDHLKEKYNLSDEQEREYFERLQTLGREAGVEFKLNSIDFIPNTVASHILINSTPSERKEEILEKLFYEGFNQGMNIGDIDLLKSFALRENLSVENFEQALKDPLSKERVMHEFNEGRAIGVKGVPFYIINDKYAIYGAQKPEIILQVLNRVKLEKNSINLM